MGYFPRKFSKKGQKVTKDIVTIRKEKETEYHKTEEAVLRAFWNKHHMGCNEHLLVHKLRDSEVYLPELSRVAVAGDEIVGAVCFARAALKNQNKVKEVLTFGPLCVAPEWQGCGVGGLLLEETLVLAKEAGYEGIIILGDPDYYPRHGFQTCDHFGITTSDGKNFDAFMGIELVEGALSGFGGQFIEPEVFEDLPEEENEVFTKQFDSPAKQKYPCQWD
ncbi:MAG: N-acetyltransferase [Lachnospiraceae bacterium]|nr:N-acetyltransferase [Lachnospiraceae bacterium]